MQQKIKLLLSSFLLLVLVACATPVLKSEAATSGNVTPTITFKIENGNLYLGGYGEIPDYQTYDYLSRPWQGEYFTSVYIPSTITRIGQNAFSNLPSLSRIDMYATTFLADKSCFSNINPDCIIRLHGETSAYETLGNITYSSWESIYSGAPGGKNAVYIMDTPNAADHFRVVSYPFLPFVYPVQDETSPWYTKTRYFYDGIFSNVGHVETNDGIASVSVSKEPQTESFMKNMGEYTQLTNLNYLTTYQIYYYEKQKVMYTPSTSVRRFVINLDVNVLIPGANYKLIQIAPDKTITIHSDLDTNPETVTFATNYAGGIYVLVY